MQVAFTDPNGGYYQTEVAQHGDVPLWAMGMTPCLVVVPVIDPKNPIKTQIAAREQTQLMPRATREFMLLFMESNFTPEQLALNPGYQAVKDFDDEIKAMRAQL